MNYKYTTVDLVIQMGNIAPSVPIAFLHTRKKIQVKPTRIRWVPLRYYGLSRVPVALEIANRKAIRLHDQRPCMRTTDGVPVLHPLWTGLICGWLVENDYDKNQHVNLGVALTVKGSVKLCTYA